MASLLAGLRERTIRALPQKSGKWLLQPKVDFDFLSKAGFSSQVY